jgi:pimeloyl-ACP methyl ester carboxylesterase
VIAIHGFGADLYHVNEVFFAIPWLYRLGFDVMLFTLPFHGRRQTRFSPFSGHGFFAGGPSRINEAFGQAIYDLRIVIDHLLGAQGVPRLGVTGVSLGGYTAALLAAVDSRIAFSIPNVPIVSIPDLLLEWRPLGPLVSTALAAYGHDLTDARHFLAVSSPLTYRPVLSRDRLMVIGGVGDRLAPPKHARLLWEHWDRCRLHWFPGNHIMHFDRGTYLREIARFLRHIGFFEGLPEPSVRRRERKSLPPPRLLRSE